MSGNRPFIEKAPSILNKPDGSSVLFECMVQSPQPPEIKWYLKDTEIVADDRHIIKMKKMVGKFACTLTIKGPQQSDQGVIKIVATNKGGTHDREQTYVLSCTANNMYN